MARLRRRPVPPPSTDESPAQLFGALSLLRGTLACSARLCRSHDGVRCEYVDRRNRRCASAWCIEHRAVIDGAIMCRRHASVLEALPAPATGEMPPLPDVDNRAASLVNWVAQAIDSEVRETLSVAGGRAVVAQPVLLRHTGDEHERRWERAWYRRDSGRVPACRVALAVHEHEQDVVMLSVDERPLLRAVPPWIGRRDLAADDPARGRFTAEIIAALHAHLGVPTTESVRAGSDIY